MTRGYFWDIWSMTAAMIPTSAIVEVTPICTSPIVGSLMNSISLIPSRSSSKTATPRLMSAQPYGVGSTPPGAAIEERHAKRVLHVGDCPRDGGLGNSKLCGSLRHASGLRHSEQNVQLMELESVHAVVALHDCDPYGLVIWTSKDSKSSTRPECTILRLGIALRAVGVGFADRKEREGSNEHHHYSEPCRPVEAMGFCLA